MLITGFVFLFLKEIFAYPEYQVFLDRHCSYKQVILLYISGDVLYPFAEIDAVNFDVSRQRQ